MILEKIATGIVAGLVYSLTSYSKKEGQKFEPKKFLRTLGIGLFTGLIFGITDVPLELAEQFAIGMGLVAVSENVLLTVYRKVVLKLTAKTP